MRRTERWDREELYMREEWGDGYKKGREEKERE
jgi:hypothetical protein